ncbi:hypothetical protein BS47DRAFT_884102 [Hydnum rufescens UP504]|uniref:Uncharacterized protein n=1 Tax=Hydnum rufescens UP504 TaxID=1448309 RepID=A0A9P6DWZ1_9AGAM|nr:hypothetical protein BS47DRAFT_884102 [Hydnum rufescens UP504]
MGALSTGSIDPKHIPRTCYKTGALVAQNFPPHPHGPTHFHFRIHFHWIAQGARATFQTSTYALAQRAPTDYFLAWPGRLILLLDQRPPYRPRISRATVACAIRSWLANSHPLIFANLTHHTHPRWPWNEYLERQRSRPRRPCRGLGPRDAGT